MKRYVSTMMAGVAALAIAGSASAQTNVIRITGSTAFRKATVVAIGNILNAGYKFGWVGAAASAGATPAYLASGATYCEFQGTTVGANTPVDIKCLWSGSVGGIQALTTQTNLVGWLAATNLTTSGEANINTSGANPEPTESAPADIAMSDSAQSETAFTTPTISGAGDTVVGVIPFQWVASVGAPSGVSNVTALVAQALLGAGNIPLSQFTGQNADVGTPVYAVGRNADSGTRLVAYAESGYGIFTPPLQYLVEYSGTAGSAGSLVTNVTAYPAETVLGYFYSAGTSGYSSGGTVAKLLGTSTTGFSGLLMSYLGVSDAATAAGLGAVRLTYNGIPYSVSAVQEGQYPFWGYEHLLYLPSLPAAKKTVASQLATRILSTDAAVAGILMGSMNVSRPGSGGVIQHN